MSKNLSVIFVGGISIKLTLLLKLMNQKTKIKKEIIVKNKAVKGLLLLNKKIIVKSENKVTKILKKGRESIPVKM